MHKLLDVTKITTQRKKCMIRKYEKCVRGIEHYYFLIFEFEKKTVVSQLQFLQLQCKYNDAKPK